jgi:hypothetical protein
VTPLRLRPRMFAAWAVAALSDGLVVGFTMTSLVLLVALGASARLPEPPAHALPPAL